jgi:hypothetical protein
MLTTRAVCVDKPITFTKIKAYEVYEYEIYIHCFDKNRNCTIENNRHGDK